MSTEQPIATGDPFAAGNAKYEAKQASPAARIYCDHAAAVIPETALAADRCAALASMTNWLVDVKYLVNRQVIISSLVPSVREADKWASARGQPSPAAKITKNSKVKVATHRALDLALKHGLSPEARFALSDIMASGHPWTEMMVEAFRDFATINKSNRARGKTWTADALVLTGPPYNAPVADLLALPCPPSTKAEAASLRIIERWEAKDWKTARDGGHHHGEFQTVTLAEVKPESVSWLWKPYLPCGKIVMLDGDPDLGKSTIALDWAATVTTGGEWPDGTRCLYPGDVLLMAAEDGIADTIAPRAAAAGADLGRIHYIQGTPDPDEPDALAPPTLAENDQIRRLVEKYSVRLLVVDVLMAHLGSGVDSHKDQDIRRVLSPLARMADETGCTVLMLRHLNKNRGISALYRGSGSIGISGAARMGLLVAQDPDDDEARVLVSSKSNLGPRPAPQRYRIVSHTYDADGQTVETARAEWLGTSEHDADELLSGRDARTESPETNEAVLWLTDRLSGQPPTPSSTIKRDARTNGISKRTLERAAQRLGVVTTSSGFPRLTHWQFPGGLEVADDGTVQTPPHSLFQ
ncbi:MAG: AAA family ATPase [Mycobacterium sp.]